MTVNTSDITSGPYTGNNIADTFAYDFRISDKSEIIVAETNLEGIEFILTVDADYTVTNVGNDTGGTVVRTAGALPTDYTWYIRSDYQPLQLTDLESQGGFFPDVHEDALDKLTFLVQQLYDLNSRTFRLSDTDPDPDSIVELPNAATRANRFLAFDNLGVLTVAQTVGQYRGDWTTATPYVIQDLFKDPVTANVYFVQVAHTSTTVAADFASGFLALIVDAEAAAISAAAALVSENAAAVSAAAALVSENAADADATQTAADRVQTGLDVITTGDKVSKSGDTMTGDLTVTGPISPTMFLRPDSAGGFPQYVIQDSAGIGRMSLLTESTGTVILQNNNAAGGKVGTLTIEVY